ncbi:hypothetical protein KQI68_07065 [Peptoniphilus sp. MSJ-1]|uniref:Uncharacterized protein n=1 Tax=Peptoniphilus ovalis TaxID=2841503 RepID=A0ABS6FJI3_9FIRM|nr:hypothetical protein [Peptoniphilus ovalis]MBU5669598.1 hypothetical protein [Peptoniphilus ovalis]
MEIKELLKYILMIILSEIMVFLLAYQAIHSCTILEIIFLLSMAYILHGATSVLIHSTIETWRERGNKNGKCNKS